MNLLYTKIYLVQHNRAHLSHYHEGNSSVATGCCKQTLRTWRQPRSQNRKYESRRFIVVMG